MFKKNVGTVDRVIRIVLGLAFIAAYFMNPGAYSWLYLVGAVLALGTALMSSCLLYTVLGINTCAVKES